jgi:hypothetical protein
MNMVLNSTTIGSASSRPSRWCCLTGSGATVGIPRSPLFTAYPMRSQVLNPATNIASVRASATSSWFESHGRASPARVRTRTQRCQPPRSAAARARSAAARARAGDAPPDPPRIVDAWSWPCRPPSSPGPPGAGRCRPDHTHGRVRRSGSRSARGDPTRWRSGGSVSRTAAATSASPNVSASCPDIGTSVFAAGSCPPRTPRAQRLAPFAQQPPRPQAPRAQPMRAADRSSAPGSCPPCHRPAGSEASSRRPRSSTRTPPAPHREARPARRSVAPAPATASQHE